MLGKTEVVFCVERKSEIDSCCTTSGCEVDVYFESGRKEHMSTKVFQSTHVREYSPMPDAVRAMFDGKPSFAAWWDLLNGQK